MFRGFPWHGVVMFMFLAYAFLGGDVKTQKCPHQKAGAFLVSYRRLSCLVLHLQQRPFPA